MFSRIGLILLATLLIAPWAAAGGSKKGKAQVSFHLQAEQGDAPKMIYPMMVNGKKMSFKRMAEVQTDDVATFEAYPSKDKQGVYDVTITLKPKAAKRIQMLTNANRGRYMAGQVNGRPGEAMMINDQVNDGKLVVWGVANAEDIKVLSKTFKGSVEID